MRLFWLVGAALLTVLALGALPTEAQTGRRFYMPFVAKEPTATPTNTPSPTPSPTPAAVQIEYRAFVQNDGWLPWQRDNNLAGTTDFGKRMEAFEVRIVSGPPGASVRYRAHVGGIGWQDWVSNGATAGTTGQERAIEAIQIGLENAGSNVFLAYDTHVDGWSFLGHVRDFWVAGTTGQARRMNGLRAYVRRDRPEPASVKIAYQASLQDLGDTEWKRNGEEVGTTGQQRRLEAFKIMLYNAPENMGVEYRANVEGDWQGFVRNGERAGTSGESKRVNGVEIRLTNAYPGTVLSYGAHFENLGWAEYASDNPSKNNPVLGDPGNRVRLEALRIGVGNSQP